MSFPAGTRFGKYGREIFYRGDEGVMSVAVGAGPVLDPARPTLLFDDVYRRDHANHLPNYDVGPDGRFLMVLSKQGTANLHVVLNWAEELKHLAPMD